MRARSCARLAAAAFALAAPSAMPGLGVAVAQAPRSVDEASRKLENQQNELLSKEARGVELQKDMADIVTERRELNARLVETAALVQRSEAQMTAIEERLGTLEKQEQAIRTSLAREHGKISTLLAALQRMGRNPPPVIITRREDALKMVRSAMLIAVAFPGLRDEARELTQKLNQLVAVMNGIRAEGDNLRAETERLNSTRTRLASLLETKKQSLAERETELKQVREATAQIAKDVSGLNELIEKLRRQTGEEAAPTPTEPDEQVVAVLPPPSAAAAEPAPSQQAEEVALVTPAPGALEPPGSPIVEMAPTGTSLVPGKPDRIKPAIAFHQASGKLPLPAQGRRVLGFGDKTQYGGTSKGMVIETRFGARVTSPCDGWIVYAGEFRSYGQLLIINAGGGYHVLVAGLSHMDVGPGQFVLAAEPIGTMSGAPRTAQLASGSTEMGHAAPQSTAPVLYIEFRKDGKPIDSRPWWAASLQKVEE